jgi:DNA (cytosine-5)-methyltransferase 1
MKPNLFTVDLFAGCGGISEGFHQAGFGTLAQVEMNESACRTLRTRQIFFELKGRHKLSIYNEYVKGNISLEQIYSDFPDIRDAVSHRVLEVTLSDESIQSVIQRIEKSVDFHNPPHSINVFLGGPPCQPYSIINRAWVKKDLKDRKKDILKRDEIEKKNFLYRHYLELLRHFQPDVFVYENVPGLFSATSGGQQIFRKLIKDFSDLSPSYTIIPPLDKVAEQPHDYILNSVNFGVPQTRRRLILIGFKEGLEEKNPGIFRMYEKLQRKKKPENMQITVEDAISDLPELEPGHGDNRFFSEYSEKIPLTPYQKKMKKNSLGVLNHFARAHMQTDLNRYRFFIENYEKTGRAAILKDLIAERPDLTPEHKSENNNKFVDRFKVQWWSKPASTITAHLSKDGHYFIHPDITQCRSFTVREAARCQSFPDNFFFEGPRTEQFRQIGNAVPPLLARAIGKSIHKELEKIYP